MTTVRLTVAQALVRFLAAQHTQRDGRRHRLIDACWGIFGHGNVAGLGQALVESGQGRSSKEAPLPFHQGRNEQAMVHAAVGFARQRNRLSAQAVTTSIGPGATNLTTGAALATVNRLPPSCCCPATSSPAAPPTRSSSSWRCRTRATSRSTTCCAPSPATSTGCCAPRR